MFFPVFVSLIMLTGGVCLRG